MRSNGELKIEQILYSNSIPFTTEYLLGAKGFSQKQLRYDFHGFKPEEFLIEFQGVEHYKYTPFFHKSVADFQKRQVYDEKKISFALARDIPLYCIPYWEIDSIFSVEELFNPIYLARSKSHNYIAYEKYQKSINSSL